MFNLFKKKTSKQSKPAFWDLPKDLRALLIELQSLTEDGVDYSDPHYQEVLFRIKFLYKLYKINL